METWSEESVEIIEAEDSEQSFIGVFAYPFTGPALARIGAICGLVLLLGLYRRFLTSILGPLSMYIAYPLMFLNFLIGADFFFYLADCVRSSADGAVRAEDSWVAFPTNLGEIFGDFAKLALPYLICFMPPMLYLSMTERIDGWFWGLLGAGTFYFPIFLLAAVLFDSATGYNPFLHLVSIFSAFFSYCLLVLQMVLVVGLFMVIAYGLNQLPVLGFLILPIELYFLIVFAHVLGRFYFRNEKKLRWEV